MLSLNELYQLEIKDLNKQLIEGKTQLLKYKLGVRTKQRKEIHLIKEYKKYVAQVLTILNEKQKNVGTQINTSK